MQAGSRVFSLKLSFSYHSSLGLPCLLLHVRVGNPTVQQTARYSCVCGIAHGIPTALYVGYLHGTSKTTKRAEMESLTGACTVAAVQLHSFSFSTHIFRRPARRSPDPGWGSASDLRDEMKTLG